MACRLLERTVFPGCALKGSRDFIVLSRLDLDLFQPIVPLKTRIISTLEDYHRE